MSKCDPTAMNQGEQLAAEMRSTPRMHDEFLELRQERVFVMCSGEGKDPITLVASVDLDINVLSLRLERSGELNHSLDINHIKVKRSLIFHCPFAYACAISACFTR